MITHRLMLKIHYLGGLACFWYLLVLGVSSLQFNHHFPFMSQSGEPRLWHYKMKAPLTSTNDAELALTLRDSLSLIGWPLPWEFKRDSTGLFHIVLEQPGKRYEIDYTSRDNMASVTEIPKGFWRVFNSLHGAGEVPNAPLTIVWRWYTRLTIAVVVFSVFSGIYVWYVKRRNRKSGLFILIVSLFLALAWMFQLYLNG